MNLPTHSAESAVVPRSQIQLSEAPQDLDYSDATALPQPDPVHSAPSQPYTSLYPAATASSDARLANESGVGRHKRPFSLQAKRLDKKWQQRLYWLASRELPSL